MIFHAIYFIFFKQLRSLKWENEDWRQDDKNFTWLLLSESRFWKTANDSYQRATEMKFHSSKLTQTNFRISGKLTTASETWAQNTITQKVTLHRVVGIHSKEDCFLMWCIFDNPDPIFTLQLVSLRKSWLSKYRQVTTKLKSMFLN